MCQILSRIKTYLDEKNIPISVFEKSIGMSNSSFGKQLKNKGAIGTDKLENILKVYPDISPVWLLTGEGYMIKSHTHSNLTDNDASKGSTSEKKVSIISRKMNHSHSESYFEESVETRPRIPYDASAGALSLALTGVSMEDCEPVPLIPTLPSYDFTIIARGNSMYPDFHSGDEVACAFVSSSTFIQWGAVHVLDTAQGIVLKRIFDRKDNILCRSINSEYPDFEVPKNEIYHLAIVVGLIRHF